jgi:hypothetical protein
VFVLQKALEAAQVNDQKFRLVMIDNKTDLEMPIPKGCRLSLVKMSNNQVVPEDEPVFFFRGRDYLAIRVLEYYVTLCHDDGCNDYQLSGMAENIRRFKRFKRDHPERMKQPGVTKGA